MNIPTIIVLAVILSAFVLFFWRLVRPSRKKDGCSACGGSSNSGSCCGCSIYPNGCGKQKKC